MAKKQVDYSDIKRASFWITVIVSVFVALYFFAPMIAHAGYDSWGIQAEGGIVYDSITYEHYMGSATADSSGKLCDSCSGYSALLTVADSLYHFYYLYFWANSDTLKGTWAWFKMPSDTTGVPTSIVFPLRAYLPFLADSIGLRRSTYSGETVISTETVAPDVAYRTGYTDTDTLNTTYFHNYSVDIYQPGVDSLLTWSFQIQPSAIATSGLTLPTNDDLCTVYGWLRTITGDPIKGAVIQATRRSSGWGIGGSSPATIIPQIVGWTTSDTVGLFQLMLRNTGSYSDTTKGFYDIIGVHGGNELFKIEKLYIPDVDSLSIADSLSGRE